MTAFSVYIREVMRLYKRGAKLKAFPVLKEDDSKPQDIVNISGKAKKKQVFEQLKKTVIEKIKKTG